MKKAAAPSSSAGVRAKSHGETHRFGGSRRRILLIAGAVGLVTFIAIWVRCTHLESPAPATTPHIPGEGPSAEDGVLTAQQWYLAGERAVADGRFLAAERHLRQAIEQDPHHLAANNRLAYLLGVEGRCWEAAPFLTESLRQGRFTLHHLVLLGALEPVIDDPLLVQACNSSEPRDRLPLIGVARTAIKHNQVTQAESLLRELLAASPQIVESHARLGLLLVDSPPEEFHMWNQSLPEGADQHPEIWVARGTWAKGHGQQAAAAGCFLHAAFLDPNHRIAHFELGQLLQSRDESELAERFLDRAEQLRRLGFLVDDIFKSPQNPELVRQALQLTESLGRLWEAWAWSRLLLELQPDQTAARQTSDRLRGRLTADTPRTLPGASPASSVDRGRFPLPAWSVQQAFPPREETSPAQGIACFEDLAAATGLDFVYVGGVDPETGQVRMLDTTGGGVAVLDYDGDGWPDIYLTQSSELQHENEQSRRDRIFRNLGGERFADVSQQTGLGDERYSQGVTVGDFNDDGFPDLYVANFGANRLYRNNGDGTFSEVSAECGIGGEYWTTSCVMADLNGDAWPDLYDVNYLNSEHAARAICRKGDELNWCDPSSFAAEQDRLYLNSGDGRFHDVTRSAGIVLPDGKGLGIVAADFDGAGRLNLFVANDAAANFYFVNQTAAPGEDISLSNRALITGLAYSGEGLPQACMGVAADDADGDEQLDLFVTNFYDQSNTLYLRQPGDLFVDATREANLRTPSFHLLGFGTQFLDGDLDGWPDLVITNGHVLDHSHKGIPYAMRPQYMRNRGSGRFEEISASSLGAFFQREFLGRGLARLDWNRDGREDFVVSHINAPAALVTNQTVGAGHFLAVQLRGVTSNRDAIGATVRLQVAGRVLCRQLTAGDGYQASNQRQLIFGLGDGQQIGALTVRWPSGIEQTFEGLAADREILLVEGNATPILFRHQPSASVPMSETYGN